MLKTFANDDDEEDFAGDGDTHLFVVAAHARQKSFD